jgi:DNA-directed RNA polymerase subunit RPC12/RpoP
MICAKCSGQVEAEVSQPKVTNLEHVTIILIEHSGIIKCPACGQHQVPFVQAIANMAVGLVPALPKPDKNMILSPNGIILPPN